MEKRSRRRTRDLVTQAASQGLSENEIGCARISMMAKSTNALCKGRIQMRKTIPLHLLKFGLQRTAGPYSWVIFVSSPPVISPVDVRVARKRALEAEGANATSGSRRWALVMPLIKSHMCSKCCRTRRS